MIYWSWVHFIQWHVCWILICNWNHPYYVWRLLLGCTICNIFSPLSLRILHWKSKLILSKCFDLIFPPAHHIFFVETGFYVDSNNVLTSFQCVGMIPVLSVVGTISVLHNSIHFAPDMVWFSAVGNHFLFCWRYPSLGCCDVANGLVVCGIVRLIIILPWVVTNVYPILCP